VRTAELEQLRLHRQAVALLMLLSYGVHFWLRVDALA
jgi:hypothetical protein